MNLDTSISSVVKGLLNSGLILYAYGIAAAFPVPIWGVSKG